MFAGIRNLFAHALHYWRTLCAVTLSGTLVAALDRSSAPILLVTLGSAFAFASYERRRWIVMPANAVLADTLMRVTIAFGWTYTLLLVDEGRLLRIS